MSLGQVGFAGAGAGGFGFGDGGHGTLVELTKVKKRRLNVRRRATDDATDFEAIAKDGN